MRKFIVKQCSAQNSGSTHWSAFCPPLSQSFVIYWILKLEKCGEVQNLKAEGQEGPISLPLKQRKPSPRGSN